MAGSRYFLTFGRSSVDHGKGLNLFNHCFSGGSSHRKMREEECQLQSAALCFLLQLYTAVFSFLFEMLWIPYFSTHSFTFPINLYSPDSRCFVYFTFENWVWGEEIEKLLWYSVKHSKNSNCLITIFFI